AVALVRTFRQPRSNIAFEIGGDALQAANCNGLGLGDGPSMIGGTLFDAAAAPRRRAGTIAGAGQDAGKNGRLPVDHVGGAVAARREQRDVFGDWSMGRAGPLTIDDFVEIVGVRDIRRVQTLTSSVARPAVLLLTADTRLLPRSASC